MLLVTPDVQEVFERFYATHELSTTAGGKMWRRIALPGPGGLGDQDARLMDTLDFLRDVKNAVLWTRKRKLPVPPSGPVSETETDG